MEALFYTFRELCGISICLYIIYIFVRILVFRSNSKKSIYSLFVQIINDKEADDYSRVISEEEKTHSLVCQDISSIKNELKELKKANKTEIVPSSGGIWSSIREVLATPEKDRFNEVNTHFTEMLDCYKRAQDSLSHQEELRLSIRKWAIRDMQNIHLIVACFSNQIIKFGDKLQKDSTVNLLSGFRGEKWVKQVESFSLEPSGTGAELFELGQSYGGVKGAGLFVAGAAVALGEMLENKYAKEEKYAEATVQRLEEAESLLKESKKIDKYTNSIHEVSISLKQCHDVYINQLASIFAVIRELPDIHKKRSKRNPYPVVISDDVVVMFMKIIEVYDSINKIIMGAEE